MRFIVIFSGLAQGAQAARAEGAGIRHRSFHELQFQRATGSNR